MLLSSINQVTFKRVSRGGESKRKIRHGSRLLSKLLCKWGTLRNGVSEPPGGVPEGLDRGAAAQTPTRGHGAVLSPASYHSPCENQLPARCWGSVLDHGNHLPASQTAATSTER